MTSATPGAAARDGDLPLTSAQERLWFLLALHPGNRAYQFQATVRLRGSLDAAALASALTGFTARHEAYRTTFHDTPAGPVQRVHPPAPVGLPLDDLSGLPDPRAAADRLIADAVAEVIPVDRLPLVGWRLLRLADDDHLLLHLEHHLVHDGWSFNLFVDELCLLYRAALAGEPSPLPEPAPQFGDFAFRQRAWLAGEGARSQLAHWREALDGVAPYLDLPTDRPRNRVRRFAGAAPRYLVPAELADRARDLARRQRVSPFAVMLAAFEVLIGGWAGAEDFCVASGAAARSGREQEGVVGMLVNTLVLRADLRGDPSFRELLQRVHRTTLAALLHQELPFDRVVAALNPPRVPGRQPLSEVMFAFHDAPGRTVRLPGLTAEVVPGVSNGSAKFDLNVIAIPLAEQRRGQGEDDVPAAVECIWEYDRDLFDEATIAEAARAYEQLLATVTADPDLRLSALARHRRTRHGRP